MTKKRIITVFFTVVFLAGALIAGLVNPQPTEAAGVFPITFKAYNKSHSITGYRIQRNAENDKTAAQILGSNGITVLLSGIYDYDANAKDRPPRPIECEYSSNGKTYTFNARGYHVAKDGAVDLMIFHSASTIYPEKITIINNDTKEIIASFDVKDAPQSDK